MLHLRGADAKGQGAKRTMGRCVRVAADHGRSGQREALLGADDMYNPLAAVFHAEISQTKGLDVVLQRLTLGS
ncbi:hypothetical protein G6F36_016070 [Rhizopus arrhizus]|nr:hypothetical protein G6F36_016070 [Rhizopus arrhizus]